MSQPYIGGMRHIHITPGTFDQACGEIRNLRDDTEVARVLDFIAKLKSERGPEENGKGKSKPLLRHVGRFSFNEGEREALLDMVLRVREEGTR